MQGASSQVDGRREKSGFAPATTQKLDFLRVHIEAGGIRYVVMSVNRYLDWEIDQGLATELEV